MRRINEALERAIKTVVRAEGMLELHHNIRRTVPDHRLHREAWDRAYLDLYQSHRDAMQVLLAMALTDPEHERMKEIREHVYKTFFAERVSVMGYLAGEASSWPCAVEEEFRDELRRAFGVPEDHA